jgi:hypothetical protein
MNAAVNDTGTQIMIYTLLISGSCFSRQNYGWQSIDVNRAEDLPSKTPFVLKAAWGAGSSGVFLISSPDSLANIKQKVFRAPLVNRFKRAVRERKLSDADVRHYATFKGPVGLLVEQQFIPDLPATSRSLSLAINIMSSSSRFGGTTSGRVAAAYFPM